MMESTGIDSAAIRGEAQTSFGSAAARIDEPKLPPTDPESLPWAKTMADLSARMADLPRRFETSSAGRAETTAGQAELNRQALEFQLAVMTTSLTAQAAVQLMSSTAQVANRMLNQQGG